VCGCEGTVAGKGSYTLAFVRWQFLFFVFPFAANSSLSSFIWLVGNGLHMACGGFEALSCPPKLKLETERNLAGRRSPAISYMRCCALFYLFCIKLNY